ncbi:PQQ-dependent sugar dehydrogenase [Aquipuribacter sp. MA13-6]|uniref:PQQ-dependent sugar dehydrogenase n=1 Tax=unclassified Aquipuribacter TaxID=2635084 RepID=UPI003EF04D6C
MLTCASLAVAGAASSASATEEAAEPPPQANFQKVPLATEVTQPMQLTVADDGRVFFIERTGGLRIFLPDTGTTVTAGAVEVDTRGESGLQGLALDPDFTSNGWIYLYYSSIATQSKVLSRIHVEGNTLELDSEVRLLEIPTTFPPRPSHVGGSIEFGPEGDLWLSTGDDTQPYESDGYTPIDERPGREEFDAQRSSGNTNDLRGKLLRITPTDTADGGYTIPEGNLFAPGTNLARPEIYAMGFRNPFRMTVDQQDGTILLADYGPDARTGSALRGPEGYVEWMVLDGPGNYGWPYCHGPNLPYTDYDFATGTSGAVFDCDDLVNDSPNNTGLRQLPPAVAPDIAYSKTTTDPTFPELGTGGAPMAGPVYRYDPDLDSDVAFPEYYDGKGFFYEWGAHFLAAVTLEDGSPVSTEPFLPETRFNAPMDMAFGPDGAMYLAEWGRGFGRNNPDDGIYRIAYAPPGERAPVARASATPDNGATPLTVDFSSEGSYDQDEGQTLTFAWDFGDGATSDQADPTHTYDEAGDYTAVLRVTDDTGRTGSVGVDVTVGNTAPTVTIVTPVDGGFVGAGETVEYTVEVTDPEDGEVDCDQVVVQPAIGHDSHAHPLEELMGCEGSFTTSTEGHGQDANFFYVLNATYTDEGADGASALTGTASTILQPKHRQAEHYSAQQGTSESRSDAYAEGAYRVAGIGTGDWIAFEPVNLQGIDEISYRVAASGTGTIEARLDAPDGPVVATTEITPTGSTDTYADTEPAAVTSTEGTHTLYFVFTASANNAFNVDAIDFLGQGVATYPPVTVGDLTAHVDRLLADGGLSTSQANRAMAFLRQVEHHLSVGRDGQAVAALRRLADTVDDPDLDRDVERMIEEIEQPG